jgi:hypothetical protein
LCQRLTTSTAKWWLLVGALLGSGALPCPECGAPMIFHFWPIAALLLTVRTLKQRYRGEHPSNSRREDRETEEERWEKERD